MILMTIAMDFNLILFMTLLEKFVLKVYFYKIDLSFLPSRLNNILNHIVLFILPCLALNYLLILRNNRYEKLLSKYPYYKGKLFLWYFLISMGLPIVLLWIGILFSRFN